MLFQGPVPVLLVIAAPLLVLLLAVGAGLFVRASRRRRLRLRHPKDYAYVVYRGARGKDLYTAMNLRLPGLTREKFEGLLSEFTAVDMSIRALAARAAGRRSSSRQLREALHQLHPFLVHEGLERALRAAQRRARRLQRGAKAKAGVGAPRK